MPSVVQPVLLLVVALMVVPAATTASSWLTVDARGHSGRARVRAYYRPWVPKVRQVSVSPPHASAS